jgi:3-keto-5-aminohexanoate cleavage enzyme
MKQKENLSKEVFFSKDWQPLQWEKEAKLPGHQKVIIVSAAPGATISKEQNPYLPITPEEIVSSHVDAYKAGASIAHVHVRNENGRPVFNPELFKRIILEIKEKCPDILIDASLSHPHSEDNVEARLEPLFRLGLPVELGTISAGTFHTIGRDIYVNREDYLKAAVTYLQERNVKPVITAYNVKQIERIKNWAIESGLVKRPLLNLSYGLYGEPASRDMLRFQLQYLPDECEWIAETAGRSWLPVTVEALLCGGHVRAGMEDSIYMYPHRNDLIKSSVEVVIKVRRIAEEMGREIATPKEARKILKIQK